MNMAAKMTRAAALLLVVMLFPAAIQAATVTDGSDSGAGTLRQAVTGAVDGETITFAPSVTSVTLSGGQIDVEKTNLTIQGNNAYGTAPLIDINALRDKLPALAKNSSPQDITNWANQLTGTLNTEIQALVNHSPLTSIDGGGTRTSQIFWSDTSAGNGLNIKNLHFKNVAYTSTFLYGGGVIGAYSTITSAHFSSTSSIGAISDSIFSGITIDVGTFLHGGGVIGAVSLSSSFSSTSSIGAVSDSIFSDIRVTISGDLQGGGVIGAFSHSDSSSSSSIGAISNSHFLNTSVVAQGNIWGAVGVGAFVYDTGANKIAELGPISSSSFQNLTATSNGGDVYAGAVYSSGLASELVITDSSFISNKAIAEASGKKAHAGAIGIDTAYVTPNPDGHVVTLTASSGQQSIFSGNIASSGGTERKNSIHFGNMHAATSQGNAILNINPTGGTVALLDPVSVSMSNSKSFTMNIGGSGLVRLGGHTMLDAAGGSTVNFGAGPQIRLESDYQISNFNLLTPLTGALTINFTPGSSLEFDMATRPQNDLALVLKSIGTGAGAVTVKGPAAIAPFAYTSFAPVSGRWLLADSASVDGTGNFLALGNDLFSAAIVWDGTKVYIAANNSGVQNKINNSPPTAAAPLLSGPLKTPGSSSLACLMPLGPGHWLPRYSSRIF